MSIYDCETVKKALEMYPHLKNCFPIELQCTDGSLVLFTNEPLTKKEIEILGYSTKKEILSLFNNRSKAH